MASAHLSEVHYVASKRACLVGENVLNLAKLFIQILRLNFSGHIFFDTIYLGIPLNQSCLEKLNHFKSHQ